MTSVTRAERPVPAARSRTAPARRRRLVGLAVLLGALALALAASLLLGSQPLTPGAVWHALTAPTGTDDDIIVRSLRAPRTALAALAGLALGVAGAVVQGHTRNPLADPGLLGVTQGAALAVVLGVFILRLDSLYGYVWFAFAGALVASVVVFALGTLSQGGPTPLTLVLAGAAMSAFLGGLVSALVLLDQQSLDVYRFWRVGSVAGRPADIVWQVLPFIVVGVVLALVNAPGLNALALGDDLARALGIRVGLTRATGIAAITVLTGAAVAACGPIGFVGLIVPQFARFLTGPDHRWLLPYSGLLGALLLLVADVIGRVVAPPGELEVGIVIAVIGCPFFLYLIRRRKLAQL
ncbi:MULTISPECIES: FecCD family ABC transporter permease [unclassified Streptomyces]|uniref:FecCD family ABC transporter permease n=1 Tax=unclassified Streptomyces TaxID=2593676 RepID=UPI00380A88D5